MKLFLVALLIGGLMGLIIHPLWFACIISGIIGGYLGLIESKKHGRNSYRR